jgi:hypothetical protein
MSRYYPVLSECILEDFGAYKRFQVNKCQIWHRYNKDDQPIWIPAFENLDDFEKHMVESMGVYHHWYNKPMGCWYTNRFPMREGLRPSIEVWYQDYLKSRATATS